MLIIVGQKSYKENSNYTMEWVITVLSIMGNSALVLCFC